MVHFSIQIVPSSVRFIVLSRVKINLFPDRSRADGAEVVAGKGVHQAIVAGTIDAFGNIAATFINAEFLGIAGIKRSGDRGIFIKHVFPFLVKVHQGGQVGLPGFNSFGIHVVIAGAAHVFITKTEE